MIGQTGYGRSILFAKPFDEGKPLVEDRLFERPAVLNRLSDRVGVPWLNVQAMLLAFAAVHEDVRRMSHAFLAGPAIRTVAALVHKRECPVRDRVEAFCDLDERIVVYDDPASGVRAAPWGGKGLRFP